MNDPRTIPYEFHVFATDGFVWLFDNSERTFPCTAEPHIHAEPLYSLDGEFTDFFPEPGLFLASILDKVETIPIETDAETDTDWREAWDDAREEACANCRI